MGVQLSGVEIVLAVPGRRAPQSSNSSTPSRAHHRLVAGIFSDVFLLGLRVVDLILWGVLF